MKKKITAFGIILLLLFTTIPTMTGHIIQNENKNFNISNNNSLPILKPDLEIVDVEIDYYSRGWPKFLIDIKNNGFSVSWGGECCITFKKLFMNITKYSKSWSWSSNENHFHNAIKRLNTNEIEVENLPPIFFGRVFFEVDPKGNVNESNEQNNVVWSFTFVRWFQSMQWTIGASISLGKLRQH